MSSNIHTRAMKFVTQHGQRTGQAYFNAAYQIDQAWTDSFIRGVLDLDPFHRDQNLPAFLALWHIDH